MPEPIENAAREAVQEAIRASLLWPTFASAHEGYSILLEEVDELKEHVWKKPSNRDLAAMREEAVQVAAMALRFIVDVCDK